jgi:hypothetical protein
LASWPQGQSFPLGSNTSRAPRLLLRLHLGACGQSVADVLLSHGADFPPLTYGLEPKLLRQIGGQVQADFFQSLLGGCLDRASHVAVMIARRRRRNITEFFGYLVLQLYRVIIL